MKKNVNATAKRILAAKRKRANAVRKSAAVNNLLL